MVYDFHSHSTLSDGALSPIELIRRAVAKGYRVIAITDHAGFGTQAAVIEALVEDCERASREWDITAIPGVELTHIPKSLIEEAAQNAKALGAKVVAIHGETIVEPVETGTNLAAVNSSAVDILAHPGLITLEEAQVAARNNVFLELSTRRGHSLTNGHVAQIALAAKAKLVLNSDAHEPDDLLTTDMAIAAARGAGLTEKEIKNTLEVHPLDLLRRIQQS